MTIVSYGATMALLAGALIVLMLAKDIFRAFKEEHARIEAMRDALGPLPDDEPGREVYP